MAIARRPTFILDCPDPEQLARFYADVLGWDVLGANDPMVFIGGHGQEMGFQRVADFRPPDWPGQVVPQQMHLDVFLDDLDAGEAAVLELGATKHAEQPGESFRVFLDPAGHPFCLCQDDD